jgi:hypothetical protein
MARCVPRHSAAAGTGWLQVECVLSQTGAQETSPAVPGSAQYGTVRQPHHRRGACEEDSMSRSRQRPQSSGTSGAQRE